MQKSLKKSQKKCEKVLTLHAMRAIIIMSGGQKRPGRRKGKQTMMTAKMMETLKNAGIANEWHKAEMHRLYIDLAKAAEMYYNNNEHLEHGRLIMNSREIANGKLWVDLETGMVCTKGISMDEDVIAQIMELVAFLMPAEEAAEPTDETARVWYAVLCDRDDTDHGTGSYDREEAIRMAREYRRQGDTEAYIALIDPEDDYCIDEMHDI